MSSFDMYKSLKEENTTNLKIENFGLAGIINTYESNTEILYNSRPEEFYRKSMNLVRGIDYTIKDIESFCLELNRYTKENCFDKVGLYISALINNKAKKNDKIVIDTLRVYHDLNFIGYRLDKDVRIILNGHLISDIGLGMKKGKIIVNRGGVIGEIGEDMIDGKIIIKGVNSAKISDEIHGGKVYSRYGRIYPLDIKRLYKDALEEINDDLKLRRSLTHRYRHINSLIEKVDNCYGIEDIEKFCLDLKKYQHLRNFKKISGLFLSSLIDNKADPGEPITLDFSKLKKKIDYVGYMSTPVDLTVKGDLGVNAFACSREVRLKVYGNVGDGFAALSKNLEAEINGNAGENVGFGLRNSTIKINGRLRSLCNGIESSQIYLNGKRIFYHNGKRLYRSAWKKKK